jgi:Sec7-like guanine-nucleotide exchange factor
MNISRETLMIPEREEGEAPGRYLERIEEVVDRSMIASALSKTSDAFSLAVLRSYMRKFAFFGDPIDMAIRKLLMQVTLPKETQQIDRVLQGFADRYHECNPGIYPNPGMLDRSPLNLISLTVLQTKPILYPSPL